MTHITLETIDRAEAAIDAVRAKSAWQRGVKLYAFDLLDELREALSFDSALADKMTSYEGINNVLLNGASSWHDFSYGGMALIYDQDIAERLCTPSELRRTEHGKRPPRRNELWPDVQAKALMYAAYAVCGALSGDYVFLWADKSKLTKHTKNFLNSGCFVSLQTNKNVI